MEIKIVALSNMVAFPQYQTEHSAAMDLVAAIGESLVLSPMERRLVPTGIAIGLPDGYEAQIRARSGLALKHGITMANGIGTIDSDYRGEIGVMLINLGAEPFVVEPGMRVAQMVIARYERVLWKQVSELSETRRGKGGFGSTGQ